VSEKEEPPILLRGVATDKGLLLFSGGGLSNWGVGGRLGGRVSKGREGSRNDGVRKGGR